MRSLKRTRKPNLDEVIRIFKRRTKGMKADCKLIEAINLIKLAKEKNKLEYIYADSNIFFGKDGYIFTCYCNSDECPYWVDDEKDEDGELVRGSCDCRASSTGSLDCIGLCISTMDSNLGQYIMRSIWNCQLY